MLALAVLAVCGPAGAADEPNERVGRRPVGPGALGPYAARHGMISTSNEYATLAGLEVLRQGGNAVDAMAAVQFVLNVVEPHASGIGGGNFIMVYDADRGRVEAIDGREEAPAAMQPNAFLDDSGEPVPFRKRVTGGRPVGVPGTLAAIAYTLDRHGTWTLAETLRPAIELARRGVPVDERLAKHLRRHADRLRQFAASRELFFRENGEPLKVGDCFTNPDLAATFERIAEEGIEAFYEGPIGEDLVKAVRQAAVAPGMMQRTDLRRYRAVRREPVSSRYRGYRLYGMNMPTSGPTSVMMMLNLLEDTDLGTLKPGGVEAAHRLADAQNVVFADRNAYMGDADFADVPVDALLSEQYAAKRAERVGPPEAAATPVEPGSPRRVKGGKGSAKTAPEGRSTTHFCIVDRHRNVVSMTTTIEQYFGSGMVVPGRGFLLNNELTDFDANPRDADGNLRANAPQGGERQRRTAMGEAGSTRGGKRPRSSMSPIIVMRDGEPYLAVGSPGGSRIIGIVLNVLVNVLDHGMDVQAAVNAPRIVARNGPVELEPRLFEQRALRQGLQMRGFDVREAGPFGAAQAIRVAPSGWLYGAADPREHGLVFGH